MTAYRGDVHLTIEQAQRALDLLDDADQGARAIVYFVLGGAHLMRGDVALAMESMAQASVSGQRGGNLHIAVPALNSLAGLQLLRGRLRQAQATAQKAIELVTGPSRHPLAIAAGAISALADLAYEWNDLDSALAYAQQSLDLGRQWGNADTLGDAYLTLSRVLQSQGDLEGACDALQEADRIGQELSQTPMFSTQLRAAWARLWLAQGNLEALAAWAQATVPEQLDPLHGEESLALIQARLALGQPEAALRMAGPLLEMARAHDLVTMVIETLALQALACHDMGDTAGAMNRLVEALVLAEREGHVRRFVDRGEKMASLLHAARAQGIAVVQASKLLAAFGGPEPGIEPAADRLRDPVGAQPLVDPLSERELEVLRLIAAGHSNREIAEELVVAVSTVKSHANHIFGKLGVGSRTQAVAKAQELGLLA
jgi:LuxR family maltose regulon positive regulatory protein